MKRIGKILAAVILLMGFTSAATYTVSAADGGSYDSGGKIGFYGEWKPKEEDKTDKPDKKDPGGGGEVDQPDTKDPGTDEPTPDIIEEEDPKITVNVPEGGGTNALPRAAVGADQVAYTDTPKNKKVDGTLPQTGMSPYVTYAGIALLLLAHLFLLKRRKRDSKDA